MVRAYVAIVRYSLRTYLRQVCHLQVQKLKETGTRLQIHRSVDDKTKQLQNEDINIF